MMAAQHPVITVMPSRLDGIRDAYRGLVETGEPLIAMRGDVLSPAGAGSDVGMYYFIPRLAALLDVAPEQATDIFLAGLLAIGLLIACIAALMLFERTLSRLIALAAFALASAVALIAGDQYVVAPAIALGLVPPFLVLHRRGARASRFAVFLLFAGLLIGLVHVTRAHAGTAVALFMAVVLLMSPPRPLVRRWLLMAPLAAGALVGPLYFGRLIERRDTYLERQRPGSAVVHPAHPLWHSVYIGFGYLSNPYVPAYRDEIGAARVEAIAPGTPFVSPAYERILRAEVFRLAADHPFFVASTVFAKLGVLALYLITFANIGLLAAWRRPNPRPVEAAFWVAIAFSALHGLLVVPWATYLSGYIAFAALYGAVSLNALLEMNPRMGLRHALQLGRRTATT